MSEQCPKCGSKDTSPVCCHSCGWHPGKPKRGRPKGTKGKDTMNKVRLAITIDPKLLAQVDAYKAVLAEQSPGVSANRSVAIRVLLHKGLERVARECGLDQDPHMHASPGAGDTRPKGGAMAFESVDLGIKCGCGGDPDCKYCQRLA